MKKIICLLVSMLMVLSLCIPAIAVETETMHTTDLSTEDTELVVIHEKEKNQRIDDLFALRCELSINFDDNKDAILQIDGELAELGVDCIGYGDVLNALGYDAVPSAVIENDDRNTQWTSRRLVSTYRGQHYELQIIEAVPLTTDSCLRRSDGGYLNGKQQITAGVTEIFKTLGVVALGATPIPEIADAITFLDTVVTVGGVVLNTLPATTILKDVPGTGLITFSTHMKIVLVKPYQAADSSQVWLYTGNYVTIEVSSVWEIDSPIGEHGSVGDHAYSNFTNTAFSIYFDDYSIALKNYCSYQANQDFTLDYSIHFIDLYFMGEEKCHEVPHTVGTITIP